MCIRDRIYTVNTNQYDIMSDKHFFHKNVKYVCFYSGEINKVGKWEYIKINRNRNSLVQLGFRTWQNSYMPCRRMISISQ